MKPWPKPRILSILAASGTGRAVHNNPRVFTTRSRSSASGAHLFSANTMLNMRCKRIAYISTAMACKAAETLRATLPVDSVMTTLNGFLTLLEHCRNRPSWPLLGMTATMRPNTVGRGRQGSWNRERQYFRLLEQPRRIRLSLRCAAPSSSPRPEAYPCSGTFNVCLPCAQISSQRPRNICRKFIDSTAGADTMITRLSS